MSNTFWFVIILLLLDYSRVSLTENADPSDKPTTYSYINIQERLHKYIEEKKINPLIVPQTDPNVALPISFDFFVNQVVDADAAKSIFSVDATIVVSYKDYQQSWPVNAYPGIKQINKDPRHVWHPVILLLGGLKKSKFQPDEIIRIRHEPPLFNSSVNYDINSMFVISCPFQVFKFPFDDHICEFQFQLYSTESDVAYFENPMVNKTSVSDHFTNHVEWDIKEIRSSSLNHTESETGQSMSSYTTVIHISRRSASYLVSILLPAIGLMIVSLVIFMLPPESGEKIGLSITVLLSYTVFNLTLYTALPKSKTICLVGWLMAYLELLSVVAILLSGLVLRCYYKREDEPLSKWAHFIIAFTPHYIRSMCCRKQNHCLHSPPDNLNTVLMNRTPKSDDPSPNPNNNNNNFIETDEILLNLNRHSRQSLQRPPNSIVTGCVTSWQEFSRYLDSIFIYFYLLIYTVMIVVSCYYFMK